MPPTRTKRPRESDRSARRVTFTTAATDTAASGRRADVAVGFGILVGSYEGVVMSLALRQGRLALVFSSRQHVGCVTAVAGAAKGKFLVSAGMDERIVVYRRKGWHAEALGNLAAPFEVTCATFATSQHLLVGMANGKVAVYRTRDWERMGEWEVHEKKVVDVTVYEPSNGSLVVSVGADRYAVWIDATRGAPVTKQKLEAQPLQVTCGEVSGQSVVVVLCRSGVAFFTLDSAELILMCSVVNPKDMTQELQCMTLCRGNVYCGAEGGLIWLANTTTEVLVGVKETYSEDTVPATEENKESIARERRRHPRNHHGNRVRCMSSWDSDHVVTCDSKGSIIIWRVNEQTLQYQCSANASGMLTCVVSTTI